MPGCSTSWAPSCEASPRRCVQRVSFSLRGFHPSSSDPMGSLFDAPEPRTSLPTPSPRVANHENSKLHLVGSFTPRKDIDPPPKDRDAIGTEISTDEGRGIDGWCEDDVVWIRVAPWRRRDVAMVAGRCDTRRRQLGHEEERWSAVLKSVFRGLAFVSWCGRRSSHSCAKTKPGPGTVLRSSKPFVPQ